MIRQDALDAAFVQLRLDLLQDGQGRLRAAGTEHHPENIPAHQDAARLPDFGRDGEGNCEIAIKNVNIFLSMSSITSILLKSNLFHSDELSSYSSPLLITLQ